MPPRSATGTRRPPSPKQRQQRQQDTSSGGGADSGTQRHHVSRDIDSENVDQLVEFMADNMEQASGGALTHEEATCISEGLLDELGLARIVDIGESGENPFTDPS